MIESDEWGAFDIGKKTPSKEKRGSNLEELAAKHLKTTSDLEALTVLLGQLETEIAHVFPEEAGERAMSTDTFEIVLNRSERWQWDKKALEDLYTQDDLPDFIKRSMSVDKRKFQKLPTSEQERLKFALTRTLDKPKIKVIPHV